MKTKQVFLGLVILALLLSGCAAKSSSPGAPIYDSATPYAMPGVNSSDAYTEESGKSIGVVAIPGAPPQQMVMTTASLTIIVDDPALILSNIQQLASGMGGFTVSSNLYRTWSSAAGEVPQADVTIRVPAKRVNEAIDKIKAMTDDPKKFVLNENISGQDITREYTDLNSRLRNLEEANAKLSELYKNAETTEDALAIFSQKVQITEQIEVIKGQIKYFEDSVSTSGITIQVQSKETIAPITVAGWTPSGVARDALQALINFGKGLVNFLIWFVILGIPILIVIGLPVYFLVRWIKRRGTVRKQAAVEKWLKENQSESVPPVPVKQD